MSNFYQHLTPDYQEKVLKRWEPIINVGDAIGDEYTKIATAMVLENTQNEFDEGKVSLNEEMYAAPGGALGAQTTPYTQTQSDARIPAIVIPTVRRIFPELLAHECVGVQPMSGPVGFAFAFRALYNLYGKGHGGMQDKEIGYNNMSAEFTGASGAAVTANASYWTSFAGSSNATLYNGVYYPNGQGAALAGSETWQIGTDMPMAGFRMEKGVVEAKSRKLAAHWSLELAEDMQKMHGVNVDSEMVNILSYEIQAEIDRQLLSEMVKAAINGGMVSRWTPV